jgi:aspartate kinase
MDPKAPGTLILPKRKTSGTPVACIASKRGISLVNIVSGRMLGQSGFMATLFDVFRRHDVAVDLIATSEVSVSLTVDNPDQLPAVERDLAGLGEVKVLRQMAIVSVVGRGFVTHPGLAGRIFQTLREVNVVMISFGASDVNLSFVVAEADAERTARLLHQEFFGTGGHA